MKIQMKRLITAVLTVLLCLTLASGAAFASDCGGGGSSGGGSGGGGGGGGGQADKETKAAYNKAKRASSKAVDIIETSGGSEATTVEVTKPGEAIVAAKNQAPQSDSGISDADRDRLDGVSVNKGAPVPSKLQ